MQVDIKFKSIALRWFMNMFLIIVLIVCTVVVAFSLIFVSIYTERIEALSNDLAYEFNALANTTVPGFRDAAIELAANFQYKDNRISVFF